MRFTIQPAPGESGFSQWAAAMKMVAQLPGGIPPEFRRRLWLTLAERHLVARGVDWPSVERTCFSEWSHPADSELGIQIVKDLHRTGCSLFCGEDGQENQALLKRVLLAYARWNKAVGYCQGFNMLAALILQVTDKCESDALKLMIYLIEGVLPDSYFADSLRGLSVDMAVFRELLRSKLPRLSKHLDTLQSAAKDGSRSYEPPLTNVFTMQWFLTLFCNCLPQPTVLRVWDLILLEGNEILLRTALAIWQVLAERILSVRSADEFYCIMGVLTRELLEFGLVDGNSLIKAVVTIGPLTELKTLRDHYLYNINPWGASLPQSAVEKQLKLYTRQSIALDISALKKQYSKLKQRQRQAHIIFSAAISRQPTPTPPVTMNHLLLGKSALVPAKRLGPPKGAIPPVRQTPSTLYWKDEPKPTSSSSSSDTELCDDESDDSSTEEEPAEKCQFNDNPPSSSDNVLMINDNKSAESSASESNKDLEINTNLLDLDSDKSSAPSQNLLTDNPKLLCNVSDTFDTASINFKVASESDDENFDFEQFLSDRVKCLKENNVEEEEEPDERIDYARRNSGRALQIIQENSIILHRILQCQSRLSPSPPLFHDLNSSTDLDDDKMLTTSCSEDDVTNKDDFNFQPTEDESLETQPNPDFNLKQTESFDIEKYNTEIYSQEVSLLKQTRSMFETKVGELEELKSPEYGSRYTSILEKSKSLDERYNALILNIPPPTKQITEKDNDFCINLRKEKFQLNNIHESVAQTEESEMSCDSPFTFSASLQESIRTESFTTTNENIPKICKDDSEYTGNENYDKFCISEETDRSTEEVSLAKNEQRSNKIDFNPNYPTKLNYSFENQIPDDTESISSRLTHHLELKEYHKSEFETNSPNSQVSPTFSFDIHTIPANEENDSAISCKTTIFDDTFPSKEIFSPIKSPKYTYSHSGSDSLFERKLSPMKSPNYISNIFSDSFSEDHSSPITSPKYTLKESSVYKIKDSETVSSCKNSPDYSEEFSNKYFDSSHKDPVSNAAPNAENERDSIYSLSTIPESGNKTCYNYLLSDKESIVIDDIKETTEDAPSEKSETDLLNPANDDNSSHLASSTKFDYTKYFLESNNKKSPTLDVSGFGESSHSKSPLKSPLKSPNRAFNPFPVPLSSRQNKEVPLKLGLYKK